MMNFIHILLLVCVSHIRRVSSGEETLTTKRVLTCHQEHLRVTQRIFIEFECACYMKESRFDVHRTQSLALAPTPAQKLDKFNLLAILAKFPKHTTFTSFDLGNYY